MALSYLNNMYIFKSCTSVLEVDTLSPDLVFLFASHIIFEKKNFSACFWNQTMLMMMSYVVVCDSELVCPLRPALSPRDRAPAHNSLVFAVVVYYYNVSLSWVCCKLPWHDNDASQNWRIEMNRRTTMNTRWSRLLFMMSMMIIMMVPKSDLDAFVVSMQKFT